MTNNFTSNQLVIIGTGGFAKEVAQLARQIDPEKHRWEKISYATNDINHIGAKLPFGTVEMLDSDIIKSQNHLDVAIGIGHPHKRREIAGSIIKNRILHFPNLIHSSVDIDIDLVKLGIGNIITKGVITTCDIQIGDFNVINLSCTIGHDASIGNFNVINPSCSISGNVKIGDCCLLGTGSRILEGLSIDSCITIGAGSVTTKSLNISGIYIGIPSRLKE